MQHEVVEICQSSFCFAQPQRLRGAYRVEIFTNTGHAWNWLKIVNEWWWVFPQGSGVYDHTTPLQKDQLIKCLHQAYNSQVITQCFILHASKCPPGHQAETRQAKEICVSGYLKNVDWWLVNGAANCASCCTNIPHYPAMASKLVTLKESEKISTSHYIWYTLHEMFPVFSYCGSAGRSLLELY